MSSVTLAFGSSGSSATISIDISSPLFLSVADSPGQILIPDQLVDSESYASWSSALYNAFLAKNKQGFVDGTFTLDQVDDALHFQWKRCNDLVISWISSTCTKGLISNNAYSQSASVIWADLKERFGKVNGMKVYSLQNDIYSYSQGSLAVAEYYTNLKNLWEDFESLVPVLPNLDVLKEYKEHLKHQKLYKFLMGLNNCFAHARTQILLMSPPPSINKAHSLLVEEEQRQKRINQVEGNTNSQAVFFGAKAQNNNGKQRRDPNIVLEHCKKPSHKRSQCYRLIGFPSNYKFKGKNQLNSTGFLTQQISDNTSDTETSKIIHATFTEEQYQKILQLLSKEQSTSSIDHVVNMAGQVQWDGEPNW